MTYLASWSCISRKKFFVGWIIYLLVLYLVGKTLDNKYSNLDLKEKRNAPLWREAASRTKDIALCTNQSRICLIYVTCLLSSKLFISIHPVDFFHISASYTSKFWPKCTQGATSRPWAFSIWPRARIRRVF